MRQGRRHRGAPLSCLGFEQTQQFAAAQTFVLTINLGSLPHLDCIVGITDLF